MKTRLLSCSRIVNTINPELNVPPTSVLAVNIDREKFEEIRKNKKISVRTLEKRLNLSKSRYYRWIQYQIDLPIELMMGIKKAIGLTNFELTNLFISSTDEHLQILTVLVYTSLSEDKKDAKFFAAARKEIEKFRRASEENVFYKLILAYSDLVVCYYEKTDPTYSLQRLENYFWNNDYYTIFDITLYLAVLRLQLITGLFDSNLKNQISIVEKGLLKKLVEAQTVPERSILCGFVTDLALTLIELNQYQQASQFIDLAINSINTNWKLDNYNKTIFKYVDYLAQNPNFSEEDAPVKIFKRKLKASTWCLPKNEITFLKNLTIDKELN